jgi:hypothetical protein
LLAGKKIYTVKILYDDAVVVLSIRHLLKKLVLQQLTGIQWNRGLSCVTGNLQTQELQSWSALEALG